MPPSPPLDDVDRLFTHLLPEKKAGTAVKSPVLSPLSHGRQPIHTLYGGAHLFKAETIAKLSRVARTSFETYSPTPRTLADCLGLKATEAAKQAWLEERIYESVGKRLADGAIEDYRIDFEDGFGPRSPSEEDRYADVTAHEVALAAEKGLLAPRMGIRIKSLSPSSQKRALRTLTIFLTRLLAHASMVTRLKAQERSFVITLPKVEDPAEVSLLAKFLSELESQYGLNTPLIPIEIMIESPLALFNAQGLSALPHLVAAGEGRVIGAHLGAYDYTASCDITARDQSLDHPACHFARQIMQVALSPWGLELADGATTDLPIGDPATVHRAWRQSFDQVLRGLKEGFYQGWDLHPHQIPPRLAATHWYYLDGLEIATHRLKHFVNRAAQAVRLGGIFDDAASGRGLLNFFKRGLASGALTAQDLEKTSLVEPDLHQTFDMIIQRKQSMDPS